MIRIGYSPGNLPMSFFNVEGELVGHDIDMAQLLGAQLECQVEFVPFEFSTLPEQLARGDFDIAMSGIAMLTPRLPSMIFTRAYMNVTAALVVPDHRREEFNRRIDEGNFSGINLGDARQGEIRRVTKSLLPGAEYTNIESIREYCETPESELDGVIWGAEYGSAWTLLYPEFSVIPIRPIYQVPVGFAVSLENRDLADLLSRWLLVLEASNADEQLYDHWILGKIEQKREPRWSVIRNVLHWVD
jgi:ABC-type amino acid transport substrate-binding protein